MCEPGKLRVMPVKRRRNRERLLFRWDESSMRERCGMPDKLHKHLERHIQRNVLAVSAALGGYSKSVRASPD